jgi:murein DD-endopeptidase MepM/ murein hydrolase activator NlpD
MENLFIYLLKVHLAIALFYLVYRLVLSKNTTHKAKRFYLLSSLLFALCLPFINLSLDFENNTEQSIESSYFSGYEELTSIQFLPTAETFAPLTNIDGFSISFIVYLVISMILFCYTLFDLIKIMKSVRQNRKDRIGKLKLIVKEDYKSPSSFFNFIFIKTSKNFRNTPEYFHELAHVKQLHSIDRLLIEVLFPLFWINPFIYLFKKSMIEVHEHLADKEVLNSGVEASDYQKYLFLKLKSDQFLKLASNFNYSLTKKRIAMISMNISKRKSFVRVIIGLVFITGIFVFYGFNNQHISTPVSEVYNRYSNSLKRKVPSILPLKPGGQYFLGAEYGFRKHPILGYLRKHNGIDITADRGTEVIATANGIVSRADYAGGYGNCVRIEHSKKFETRYAHLQGFNVRAGEKVKRGDVIGFVGATGLSTSPHLHYEVLDISGKDSAVYLNPADYIKNIKEIPTKKNEK